MMAFWNAVMMLFECFYEDDSVVFMSNVIKKACDWLSAVVIRLSFLFRYKTKLDIETLHATAHSFLDTYMFYT